MLDVATTPEIRDSGLLDDLRRHSGQAMRVHATDSVRAARMFEDEVVDIFIGHSSESVRGIARHEPTWVYRAFASNHAVLVGPTSDPAGVRRAADGADAFRRIAASSSPFVTHELDADMQALERNAWSRAFVTPPPWPLITSRQGITGILGLAAQRQGYTLVNEALFRRFRRELDLDVLLARESWLVNLYAVIFRRDDVRAGAFGEWVTRGGGRERVAGYRVDDHAVFTVWLEGCPDSHLEQAPCRRGPSGKPIKDELVYAHGMGPPATIRQMTSEADAVVVARYTGRSRELSKLPSTPDAPPPPRVDRLGEFHILEVVKPHRLVPAAGELVEITVPGSYEEFPTYILHTFADNTEEPVAGRDYAIFVRHVRLRGEEWLASAWSAYSTYDISGEYARPLSGYAHTDYSPARLLAEVRRAATTEPSGR